MTTPLRRILVPVVLILMAIPSGAAEFYHPVGDWYADVPYGWELLTEEEGQVAFRTPDQGAIFRIAWQPAGSWLDARTMHDSIKEELGAEGESSSFPADGLQPVIADWSFTSAGNALRGWFLFLSAPSGDYQVSAFCLEEEYEARFPFLISCLDGFSPGSRPRARPGFITLLDTPLPAGDEENITVYVTGRPVSAVWSAAGAAASQRLIEREAAILGTYARDPEAFEESWKRYYRFLFRDSYPRLASLAAAVAPRFPSGRERDAARELLVWLQDFRYESSGTFSDLINPLESACTGRGDCDSRALIYLIMLRHLGIEGILMVSHVHAHALAAVDVPGEGARFPHKNRSWLVAELTDKVALGMIAADMADPEDWIAVDFSHYFPE